MKTLPRGIFFAPTVPTWATKADPVTPGKLAWVQGVIDAAFAVHQGLSGQSDGKVYRNYEVGSDEEFHWSMGCKYTAEKMMEGAMMREELRREDEPNEPRP